MMTRLDTVRYFSGFTGDSTILITDGRYDDQARLECPSFEIDPLRQIKDAVEIKSVIALVVLGQVVGIDSYLAVRKPGGVV